MAPIKQSNNNNLITTSTSKEIGSITISSETSNSNKNIEKSIEVENYNLDTELTITMPSFTSEEIEAFIKEETELINGEISFYEEQIKQNEELLEKIKYLQERVSFIVNEKANITSQYQYIYPNKNFDELYEIALKEKPELKDYINGLEEDLESIKKEFELDEVTINKLKDLKTYEDYQTFIDEIENDIACFNSGIYKYKSYLKTLDYKYLNYNEDYQEYEIKEYNITKENLLEVTYGNANQAYKFSYSSYCKKFGYVDEFSFAKAIEKYFPESSGIITISDELLTIEAMAQKGNDEYKKMYLYLYEKEGEKEASKFLNAIQDEINNYGGKLKADEFLKNLEENPDKATEYINNYLAEISKGTNDGIFNWIGNVKNTIDVLFDNDDVYTYSMHEYETMYILQALKEKDYGLADENVYEISQSIGNMIPSILISSTTGCPTLGAVSMGVPAGGGAAHQGLVEGYSRGQSITYGVLTGISETCLERFLGGITGIGDVNVTSFKTLLQSMGKEAVEESTQSYLDSAFRTGIFKEDYDFVGTSKDALKSGVYGAISGGIINSAMAGINYGVNKDSNISNNENLDINQKTINEEVSSININQVTEQISQVANELSEKVQEIGNNAINEQNIEILNANNDISNFINEKGLIDVKLLPLSEHEDIRIVQEKVLNNEPLTLNERLKLRDSAKTEIDGVKLYSDHMYRATSYKALLDYINTKEIKDSGGGKGYLEVDWYLGGTAVRYGKVIIETPANPNLFHLTDDYGGFMSGNPNVRHANSSNETPVKFDEVSRILFLDDTGKKVLKVVEPSNSVDLAKEVELGHLLYEQDHLLKIKKKASDKFGEERQQQLDEINKKIEEINLTTDRFKRVSLESLESLLKEDGYAYLGHGTGRRGNSNELVNDIFEEGLRTSHNSLSYTTIGLNAPTQENIAMYQTMGIDVPTMESLQNQLNNWSHFDSKKIILIKIPTEYINKLADSSDLNGERYGAFMIQKTNDFGNTINYLNPKFIIGCYDAETQTVMLNKSFEEELSDTTRKDLEKKATELRKQVEERNKSFDVLSNETIIEEEPYDGPVDEWGFPIGIFNDIENKSFDKVVKTFNDDINEKS